MTECCFTEFRRSKNYIEKMSKFQLPKLEKGILIEMIQNTAREDFRKRRIGERIRMPRKE